MHGEIPSAINDPGGDILTVSAESIITAAGILTSLGVIFGVLFKAHSLYLHQSEQDNHIEALQKKHEEDAKTIREEQTLLTYGILACLKGLKEQGCNGPVTEAINRIEKHINIEAHK